MLEREDSENDQDDGGNAYGLSDILSRHELCAIASYHALATMKAEAYETLESDARMSFSRDTKHYIGNPIQINNPFLTRLTSLIASSAKFDALLEICDEVRHATRPNPNATNDRNALEEILAKILIGSYKLVCALITYLGPRDL